MIVRNGKRSRYVALMRGINVGGKNLLPMKALAAMFDQAGCTEVATYIQSGNVVFGGEAKMAAGLETRIARQVAEQFGLRVPVMVRSAAELEKVIASNPFIAEGAEEDMLHVSFLADLPDVEKVAGLDAVRSSPDEFVVLGREIYLRLPNGAARTKLTNAYFDSKLRTVSTMRNWRTVLKLAALTSGEAG